MAKSLPSQFIIEKDKIHYKPIYLIDINSLGYHWATRGVSVRMYDGGSWQLNGSDIFQFTQGDSFITNNISENDIHTLESDSFDLFTFAVDRVASETTLYWKESFSGQEQGLSQWIDRAYTEALRGSGPGQRIDLGIGPISQEIDMLGGISSVGNVTIALLNQDLLSDALLAGDLDNAEITIRLAFDDGSQVRYDETDLLFKGLVDDVDFDKEEINLHCIKSDIKSNIVVPGTAVNKQDFPNAPDESIGTRIQRVYGNFWDGNDSFYSNFDLVPAILTDPEDMTYTIADHILIGLTLANSIFMDVPLINSYAPLTLDNGALLNTTPPAGVRLDSPIKAGLFVRKFTKGDQANIDDFYKVMDRTTSYITIGNNQNFYIKIPDLSSLGKTPGGTNNIFIRYFLGTISGVGNATVRYHQSSGSTGKILTSSDSNTMSTYVIDTDDSDRTAGNWTWEELASTDFGITCDANISVQLKNFILQISNVIIFSSGQPISPPLHPGTTRQRQYNRLSQIAPTKKVPPQTFNPESIYIKCRGKEYEDWLKEPGRSNSKFIGDTIESAAGIVEDLLRHAGNSSEDIDIGSFDTALGGISEDNYWGLIQSEVELLDVLDNICRQSRTKLFKTYENKFKILEYDDSQSLISDGVFREDPSVTNDVFDDNPIVGEPIVSMTSPDDIINSVKVNYRFDFLKDTPRRTAIITIEKRPTNSLVDEPNTGIDGVTDPITFDIDINGVDDASDISINDYVLLDREIMKVTSVDLSLDTITCDRAQKGSTLAPHRDNTPIFKLVSKSDDGTGTRDQNSTSPNNREGLAMLSVAVNSKVNEYVINADWIRDDGEAVKLRDFLFDRLLNKLHTVNFNSFLNATHVEIGDFINIQHRSLNGLFSDITNKKWEVISTKIVPNADAGQVSIGTVEV